MTYQELEDTLRDASISDEDFFNIWVKFLAEREGTPVDQEEAVTLERLGTLTAELRPTAFERMRQYVVKQHGDCCIPKSEE